MRRARIVAMPVPPSTMLSTSARRTFERLRISPQPGLTVRPLPQPPGRGVQGLNYPAYIDQISAAICSAWETWRSTAVLVDVVINAVTAVGGKVVGPAWTPLILSRGPCNSPE